MNTADVNVRKITHIPINELIPYAKNANTHTEYQIKLIAESIERVGWTNPVLVKPDKTIVAGHGRVMAASRLEMTRIPCIVLRGVPDKDLRAYILADNQLAKMSEWDHEILKIEMVELKALDVNLESLGFDDKFVFKTLDDTPPKINQAPQRPEYTVITVCHDEEQQAALFNELTERGMECKPLA